MPRLCDAAILDSYAHVVDEVLRCLIVCMEESERDHYMFLHAALAKCEMLGFLASSWRRSQSWRSESSGLDRLGMGLPGLRFEC